MYGRNWSSTYMRVNKTDIFDQIMSFIWIICVSKYWATYNIKYLLDSLFSKLSVYVLQVITAPAAIQYSSDEITVQTHQSPATFLFAESWYMTSYENGDTTTMVQQLLIINP